MKRLNYETIICGKKSVYKNVNISKTKKRKKEREQIIQK